MKHMYEHHSQSKIIEDRLGTAILLLILYIFLNILQKFDFFKFKSNLMGQNYVQ